MVYDREACILKQSEDQLLVDNQFRWVLFPIKYDRVWNYYKKYESNFWTAEDIHYKSDKPFLQNLSKDFLESFKLLLVSRDNSVISELNTILILCDLLGTIQIPEGRGLFSFAIAMENIYNEVFDGFSTILLNDDEKLHVGKVLSEMDAMNKKNDWIKRQFGKNVPFAEKAVSYVIAKKIFGISIHLFYQSLDSTGKTLPAFKEAMDRIVRDENIQIDFFCHLTRCCKTSPDQSYIVDLIEEAVTIERNLLMNITSPELLGLKREEMISYMLWAADEILVELKMPKHFNVLNPFADLFSRVPAPSQEEKLARSALTQSLKQAHYKTYQDLCGAQFSICEDF